MVELWKTKRKVWCQKNDDKKLGKKAINVPAGKEYHEKLSRYSEDKEGGDDYDNYATPWEFKSDTEKDRIKERSKLRRKND